MIGKTISISLMITIGGLGVQTSTAQAPLYTPVPVVKVVGTPLRAFREPLIATPDTVVSHRIPSDPTQRCPQFEAAFRRYGLKPVATFSYIAWREARCRIKATNGRWDKHGKLVWTLNRGGTVDRGLLQVNSSWRTVTRQVCGGGLDKLLEIDCNLKVAKYLLEHGGLAHWNL